MIVNVVSAPVVIRIISDWCIGKQTVQYLSDAWLSNWVNSIKESSAK